MIPSSFFVKAPHGRRQIHGLIWRAQQHSAEPPLLCVHGLTRNAWDFAPLAMQLAATRDVIALDMAGRGLSDWAEPAEYTYATYIADCVHVLDRLQLPVVDWCGTSMGGLIGMLIAAQHKNRLRRFILNDVGPFIPLSALTRIAQYVGADQDFADIPAALRYCRATYADFGIRAESNWWRFTLTSLRRMPGGHYGLHYDVRIAAAFAALTQDVDLWAAYDTLACPTLLLRGSRSDVLRAEDAQKMTQRGPRARLVTFEGVGHAPALDDAAQIDAIKTFLDAA